MLQALHAFTAAPPGQQIAIMGYLQIDRAARILMLSTVEPVAAAIPKPTPSVRQQ